MNGMKDRNELIYLVRQIIGNEKEDGFYTPVKWNNQTINVPNYLFKDGTANYPEIRISPFLSESQASHSIRIRDFNYDSKTSFYNTIFQIDIYATNLPLVNKIEDTIRHRIDLFYDIDSIIYGYDKSFHLIDSEKNVYYSPKYNINNIKIIGISFCNRRIDRVHKKEMLKYKHTFFIDKEGLYVHTDFPIKMMRINAILNGLVFPDGETAHKKGIIKTRVMNRRSLSQLENNKVERVSFELGIFYRMDSLRNPGPIATNITIDSD